MSTSLLKPSQPGAAQVTTKQWLLLGAALGVSYVAYYCLFPRRKQEQNDFVGFLKLQPAKTDPNSLNSFLKTGQISQLENGQANRSISVVETAFDNLEKVRVAVLFGTEFGYSQEVAEHAQSKLQKAGFWAVTRNMANYPQGYDFSREQLVLLVCSTQGDGVPPSEARAFCQWLHSATDVDMSHIAYSVCALGDRGYPHFCNCGKQLDSRFGALGGSQLYPRMDVNKEDWQAVSEWLSGVLDAVKKANAKTVEEVGPELFLDESGHVEAVPGTKMAPLEGRVVEVTNLCQKPRDQDPKVTVLVKISTGDQVLSYTPGDALGVYPHNCPRAVDDLLDAVGCDPAEHVPVPTTHHLSRASKTLPLRDALLRCYDLHTPRESMLTWLAEHVYPPEATPNGDVSVCASGHKLGTPEGGENGKCNGEAHPQANTAVCDCGAETFAYVVAAAKGPPKHVAAALANPAGYLADRHVLDVVRDFLPPATACHLPATALAAHLRPLQPRLYSISSAPGEDPHSVQATVAVVRYSQLDIPRVGVASTYLGERLGEGDPVDVYVSVNPEFRLPSDPATPIVMIGPGTGLAPFRAFIVERLAAAGPRGRMLLFFGCRRRDEDYLYGEYLEAWAAQGAVELHTAFSREQAHKVYVQDRIREAAADVAAVVRDGGFVYVCGDAELMAPQVEYALGRVLLKEGVGEGRAPLDRVDWLAEQGRFAKDVWQ